MDGDVGQCRQRSLAMRRHRADTSPDRRQWLAPDMMPTQPTVTAARKAFGRQLAELRRAARVTQTDLAKLIDYSRSTVANIEAGYQSASPEFCQKCDEALSTGDTLRAAHDELEKLQRESHRLAASSAEEDRKARIEQWRQDERTATRAAENGTVTSVIRQALATLTGNVTDHSNGIEPDGLETCVLNAYRQQRRTAGPLCVVLVGGFPGSGKSEFARFLSSVTGWTILDKDTVTRALAERVLLACGEDPNDRHSAFYTEQVRPFEYRSLLDAMTENLRCGVSTVVTAPFLREFRDTEWVKRIRNRCATYGARLSVVWMSCDKESMHDYIVFRGAARDSWKISNWQEYLDTIDTNFIPPFDHHSVDNRLNAAVALADQAREVAARVQA
ncbi:MAG TPA: helix-turn-helix domain-containing protein [Pseudonocardiaceae bacterium]|nr:helix-turn-helix domain-containing protein [Pseudonocardiaceae bacterium]